MGEIAANHPWILGIVGWGIWIVLGAWAVWSLYRKGRKK